MKVFNEQVFDETVSGTGNTWYTPAELNDRMGVADELAIMAYVTNVTGTANVTVTLEHSADGQNWLAASASPEINGVSVTSNNVYFGYRAYWPHLLSFLRLKVTLGGTNPQCRLKLNVSGETN